MSASGPARTKRVAPWAENERRDGRSEKEIEGERDGLSGRLGKRTRIAGELKDLTRPVAHEADEAELHAIFAELPESARARLEGMLERQKEHWYELGRMDGLGVSATATGKARKEFSKDKAERQIAAESREAADRSTPRMLAHNEGQKRHAWAVGKVVLVDEANLAGEFFDGDTGTYEQKGFVMRSVFENADWREGRSIALRRPTAHFIWTVEQYNTPVPLGRYGQPHLEESSWEDFNPMRLWKEVGDGRVNRGDALWVRLAHDGSRLPFEFRSNAQRIVVSEAHRLKAPGSSRFVLPLDGEVAEVDVWHQCVNNALYMPMAIRRQYSFDEKKRLLFREWDAGDLGIYLTMRACGPDMERRRGRERKTEEAHPTKYGTGSWTELFRRAVLSGEKEESGVEVEYSKPRRYNGPDEPSEAFKHLRSCGFAAERMEVGGDVWEYARRLEVVDGEFLALRGQLVEQASGMDTKDIVAVAKCQMELRGDRLPAGRPVIRCKVREKDPLGKQMIKELEVRLRRERESRGR
ncbi:hypothetical protein AURDEDRAFT_176822 [Auricularia subglabra TFB-10046 SS5]|uniref:Uncharacterized protein n=1 Tax=Auricularia subglabra (strain TFB-10046 / SS5) TaxID=717982 RepID=J0WQG5_AURST|nr:hypothetical protein AURDEDRAFT_176822 [Auricularia subglabra TFB-10046 SS5]